MRHLICIFLLLLSMTSFSQNSEPNSFCSGKFVFSVGYGFPSLEESILGRNFHGGLNMTFDKTGYGPIHFRGEYGLSDKIGIGVSINYDHFSGTLKGITQQIFPDGTIIRDTYQKTITSLTGLLRFNYHFATNQKLDPYFSIGAGFRLTKTDFTTDNPRGTSRDYDIWVGNSELSPFPIGFEAVAGLRYYCTKHIGIYSEMGIAKSIIQIGLTAGF